MEVVPVKVSSPITFEEAKEGHYRLWDYLAKTGDSLKPEAAWKVLSGGYACEYANNFVDDEMARCQFCPIFNDYCGRVGTLYLNWCRALDIETRKDIAKAIRDLPWTNKSGLLTTTK